MASERGSILVLPGGGYRVLADHEGQPVADWLESLGWDARVVRYPVETRHPGPLAHVRAEIAAERRAGARRVGILGFSAGGHLAGHAAVDPGDDASRPDFAVLCYPVVSMVARPHVGSRDVLVGDGGDVDAAAVSVERLVDAATPPIFAWHTVGDDVVPVTHTYLLGSALASEGIDHEVHTFPGDVHGIGLAAGDAAGEWTALCAAWLERRATAA